MSSFFSSRSKSQVRISSQSNKSSNDGSGDFDNRSRLSFSKMRKKRPPPINIAVAGNVIITNATPQVIYSDIPWSASNPPTPRANTCSNPGCIMVRETMPMGPPLDSQLRLAGPCTACSCQQYIQSTPSNPSYVSPRHACFSAAELPGSMASPKSSVELDVPATPTRLTFEHLDEHILDSPPNLTLSPKAETTRSNKQDHYQFGRLLETEPIRRGKRLGQMDYDELMEILPDLTPDQVTRYWSPAIRKQLEGAKNNQSSPSAATRSSTWSGQTEVSDSKEDPEQVRAECEIRLNTKENEITGLIRLHDSRINALCKFISKHLKDQLESSNDKNHQAVREIVSAQQRRGRDPFDADLQHMYQSRQIQELQDHISKLEPVAIRNEKRARAYKDKAKTLQEDIIASKETQELLKQELVEKDAYIDILNNKVTQLLTMRPDPFPPSDARGSRKHLPSPAPCDWKRVEELKHQVAS
ncbi:hypothetical protein MGYG_00658 [Nannizzia gypsea CBS 118893]|uniref:Uncharacterized protein n=1 Tax=Arthroderma gypseum (strain ATCC MYA-4604 / CBS 118893) TaxID=535722 RepID=E5R115_ARTGP|nr:hypothetical protein MGYG_00658 [Nannizzia gypsea CBS 118893]EFQ97619.1 hypothetical protein MGYG_00658 [Nannizzia gypsea CBS 118893]